MDDQTPNAPPADPGDSTSPPPPDLNNPPVDSPITRQDLRQVFEDILKPAPAPAAPPPSRAAELKDDPVATVAAMRATERRMLTAIREHYKDEGMPPEFFEGIQDRITGVDSLEALEELERQGAHFIIANSDAMELQRKGSWTPVSVRKHLASQPSAVAPPPDKPSTKNHPIVQAELDAYAARGITFTEDQIKRANEEAARNPGRYR